MMGIVTKAKALFMGLIGSLEMAVSLGVNARDALIKYGPLLAVKVREVAEMVELAIPDGLPESKIATFDAWLKWYLQQDKAIREKINPDDPEVLAAARLILETYLADRKARTVQ